MKRCNLQKRVSKFMPKKFMRLAPRCGHYETSFSLLTVRQNKLECWEPMCKKIKNKNKKLGCWLRALLANIRLSWKKLPLQTL